MIELNPDEQEAAAEFIRMMKALQSELDELSNKLAVFQACAVRAASHCAEHADKLPYHPTSQLKPMLSGMAHTLHEFGMTLKPPSDSITSMVNDFGRVVREMELEARKGKH